MHRKAARTEGREKVAPQGGQKGVSMNTMKQCIGEDRKFFYVNFFSALIESIGYDPQRALLEVRLQREGRVRQYEDVPEDIWYGLRENNYPDMYYRRHICGHYRETAGAEMGSQ